MKLKLFLIAVISIPVHILIFIYVMVSNTYFARHNKTINLTLPLIQEQPVESNSTSSLLKPIPAIMNISDEVQTFLSEPPVNRYTSSYVYTQEFTCGELQNSIHTQRSNTKNLQTQNKNHRHKNIKVDILFVIPSAISNTKRRERVRGSQLYAFAKKPENKARLLFFLGSPDPTQPNALKIQADIDAEVKKHGDIVQELYTDVYRNILLKAVAMLRWTSTFCTSSKYVIRVDDDVKVDVTRLVSAIHEVGRSRSHFILAGTLAKKWKVFRDPQSKYFISKDEYPDPTWPPFALGGLLGYTPYTARLLYEASLRVTPVWLDDVFITGMCGSKVNAPLVTHPGFSFKH